MNLRELRYQINFQLVKNIRRYIYDIEQKLTELLPNLTVQPIPQLPDNVDPTIDRLNLISENQEVNTIIKVSQVSITLSYIYKQEDGLDKNLFNEEAKNLYKLGNNVKVIVKNLISDYELSHEIFTAIRGHVYQNHQEFTDFIKFQLDDDEIINNTTKEAEGLFLITKEAVARKIFDLNPSNSFYPKNNESNFVGYQVTSLFQINNRLAYNNSEEFNQENAQLKFEDIRRFYHANS